MIEPDFLTSTRTSYDTIAAAYAEVVRDEMDRRPLDRAMAGAFAELVRGRGPVADVDLSPGMLALARKALPDVRFVEGSMLKLPVPDAAGLRTQARLVREPDNERAPQAFLLARKALTADTDVTHITDVTD
ncbi:methyltransferase domain-containing protein [Nonomuraea sp. NPDC050790]|uniref:methyltransferase domain-containing protein n=1 Tax=Nonomuraea sp. NPDC050790 TaxID=3364371 RepID=UPI0037B0EE63